MRPETLTILERVDVIKNKEGQLNPAAWEFKHLPVSPGLLRFVDRPLPYVKWRMIHEKDHICAFSSSGRAATGVKNSG